MQGYKVEDTRTVAVVAHSGAGKTSVIEALLHKSGATSRFGKVDDGTSICDYNPEEKERKVTIYAKPVHFTHAGKSIFLMDTPGYADFFGDVISTLRVVDGVILVVCGESGIQVGTQRLWKKINELEIPCIIFINKLDKENADYTKVVNNIRNSFGKHCVPVEMPDGEGASFNGMKDVMTGGDSEHKSMLIESVAETDDALLEKYLSTGVLEQQEVITALKKALLHDKIVPIIGGSAIKEIGISELITSIETELPSPIEKGVPGDVCKPDPMAPYSAFVFKVITDPFVGQVTFLRVYSGAIKADSEIYNATKGVKEKLSQLMLFTGKEQKTTPAAGPGDIIAVTKLKNTKVNDTFSEPSSNIKFDPIIFPKPSVSFAVQPHARGDEEKIGNGLHRLAEEDYTFEVSRDKETKELVISGMGELHLDVMLDKLKKKFGVAVDKSTPKVAYKETITAKGDAQYRHKKQSGGAGQFAEVWLRVEPRQRGEGFEFVDDVVGGSIPQQFVVSCEKGIRKTLESGFLAGYPVVDVCAIVYDGKTHPVDSKDIAFQTAAKKAFKQACLNAKPVLLEPIMNVEIYVAPEFMGDVTGDLNGKRGRIMGMEQMGDVQVIKAQVPIAELAKYSADLKSMTGGRGSFSMEFSHYEEVPARLAQDIIAKAVKEKKEEED